MTDLTRLMFDDWSARPVQEPQHTGRCSPVFEFNGRMWRAFVIENPEPKEYRNACAVWTTEYAGTPWNLEVLLDDPSIWCQEFHRSFTTPTYRGRVPGEPGHLEHPPRRLNTEVTYIQFEEVR